MQMNQKPEYVLRRANDLIETAIGNADREKKLALEQIHAHISLRRGKTQTVWNKTYELLMKRHLELCVELKDSRTAKDGLHQYRNLCQSVDPNSLEIVIVYLMDLADTRTTEARVKANKVAIAAAAKVVDLDQEESPESIMLSSMTDEVSSDRTDREVVVPWLKFLWEIYRAVLELLHKNAKLERVYHKTCEKAFQFCLTYQRNLEFKRLCGMLHDQLANLTRTNTSQQNSNPNRITKPWEWTSEAVEYHLQTRFSQLEVATSLELWNEGFKTVEEIYNIIELSKKTPRSKIMATYYEKLMRIFWVSQNHLFHAYCSYRHYCLTCESRVLSAEEKTELASSVLLSALCIPAVIDVGVTANIADISIDEEDISFEKNQRMAKLLDFAGKPTRHSLLDDLVQKGLLQFVHPELKDLYNLMEVKFHPLQLTNSIKNAISAVKKTESTKAYAIPLQKVAVIRVLLQISHVFSSVKIDFIKKLLAPLEDIDYLDVEKIMVEGITRNQLQLKIDHSAGCLKFAQSSAVKDSKVTVDTQVSSFSLKLTQISQKLTKQSNTEGEDNKSARREYLAKVQASIPAEHAALAERKKLIEIRKEGLERLQREKEVLEAKLAEEAEAARLIDEEERIKLEAVTRELEKREKVQARMEILRIQKELERFGINKSEYELTTGMDKNGRDMLLLEAKATEKKGKDEEERRVVEQAKRLDYTTRAMRIEGAKAVERVYSEAVSRDKDAYEKKQEATRATLVEKHAANLEIKKRLADKQTFRSSFEDSFLNAQKEAFDIKMNRIRDKQIKEMRLRKVSRARELLSEAREEEEDAARAAEEEAQRDAEEQEHLRAQQRREEESAAEAEALEERRRKDAESREKQATHATSAPVEGRPANGSFGNGEQRNSNGERPQFGSRDRDDRGQGGNSWGQGDRDQGSRGGWGAGGGRDGARDGGDRGGSFGGDRQPREGGFGDRGGDRQSSFGGDRGGEREGGGGGGGFRGGDRGDDREPSRADAEGGWGRKPTSSGGDRQGQGGGGFGDRQPREGGGGGFGSKPREGGGGAWKPSSRGGGDEGSSRDNANGGGGGFGNGERRSGLDGAFGNKKPAFGADREGGERRESGPAPTNSRRF